jgi:5-methylthioadenosine/S-adenosylhomocysteine deaminase
MASKDDPFTRAYLAGMPDTLEGTEAAQPQPRDRTLPREAIALGGQIITPDGVRKGWVRIEGGTIAAVTTRKPTTAVAIQTDGIIMPGMLDLHGHPEFNVFAPWEPPKTYVNRYSWRGSKPYGDLVRTPQNDLLSKLPKGYQLRYAEIRALVGGVTAIQGASIMTQKGSRESMVRNVDGMIFGEHRARAAIDLPASLTGFGGPAFKKVLDAIENNEVDAHYVHLAEGMRDNPRSMKEFTLLADKLGALTKATVIIHGTALTRDELGKAADAGARLVWSPQSNLRLYNETTRAGDALDVGLPVALGADWLPSGSTSLLGEMKVARQQLIEQDHPISAKDLVTMVTSGAAEVAALGGKLGSLEVGRVADLVVMARQDDDVYESVCDSTPADVELVMVGGDVAYGRRDWVGQLAANAADPNLEGVFAWGRSMLLDTSFQVDAGGDPTPRLAQIRTALTKIYPPVGPVWA